ncbi:nibrin [Harmonia axyridis]|uniref:nibrin n=1 Tax=Harmonia axyridis TaxID=115357 RepID=UPI001E277B32|nr:nibrin [Harmonia axyridis]
MFLLIGNNSTYYLTKDGTFRIGRHVGDIIIGHSTISRKHAEITVENNEAFLQDCKSKYFTKYKGNILMINDQVKLEDGAEIIFGEVKFRVKIEEKFITCSTGVKENEEELCSIIKELGGEYLKDWNDTCTHLTTAEIMVTLKVLHAIMDNKKIVTPNFWRSYLNNLREMKLPPDPSEFYPPLGESMIHSKYLDYNPNRKTIFTNKTFGFWKKRRSMQDIISKAGGKSVYLLSAGKNESELMELIENCILMDPEDTNIEKKNSVFLEAYKKNGRRVIPIQEIVLAILQCSCKENCNPYFNRAQTVFTRENVKPGPSKVVIGETECFQFDCEKEQKPKVIPSSIDFENDSNTQYNFQNEGNNTQKELDINVTEQNDELPQKTRATRRMELDLEIVETSKKSKLNMFKRPAQDSLANLPKKVKEERENLQLNPFFNMKSSIRSGKESTSKENIDLDMSNNPFGQIQLKRAIKNETATDNFVIANDRNSDSNNDNSKKRKCEDILDSVISEKRTKIICKKNRKFVRVESIDFSNMNHSVSSGSWFDKTIKTDIKPTLENFDENEQKWCERFNNSVVIVAKNLWRKDMSNSSISSNLTHRTNENNFKKFRKVAVPKTDHIIKCSKIVFGKSNLGIDYQYSDDEDNRNM